MIQVDPRDASLLGRTLDIEHARAEKLHTALHDLLATLAEVRAPDKLGVSAQWAIHHAQDVCTANDVVRRGFRER